MAKGKGHGRGGRKTLPEGWCKFLHQEREETAREKKTDKGFQEKRVNKRKEQGGKSRQ